MSARELKRFLSCFRQIFVGSMEPSAVLLTKLKKIISKYRIRFMFSPIFHATVCHQFTPLIIVLVLVITGLGPLRPVDDLSSRLHLMLHDLYHKCCKQMSILLENN